MTLRKINGNLYMGYGQCFVCDVTGPLAKVVRLRDDRRDTPVYLCDMHSESLTIVRHAWACPVYDGFDHTEALNIGITHGSTYCYAAILVIEQGWEGADEWAAEAEGPYSLAGRRKAVDTVLRMMA